MFDSVWPKGVSVVCQCCRPIVPSQSRPGQPHDLPSNQVCAPETGTRAHSADTSPEIQSQPLDPPSTQGRLRLYLPPSIRGTQYRPLSQWDVFAHFNGSTRVRSLGSRLFSIHPCLVTGRRVARRRMADYPSSQYWSKHRRARGGYEWGWRVGCRTAGRAGGNQYERTGGTVTWYHVYPIRQQLLLLEYLCRRSCSAPHLGFHSIRPRCICRYARIVIPTRWQGVDFGRIVRVVRRRSGIGG